MTALKRYDRLEAPGLWRPAPGAQRRDVVVSVRRSSLVIADFRNNTVLSHWSLPAVVRLNPGRMPALFGPGGDETETLELDEAVMIDALEEIAHALSAGRARGGRLRVAILGLFAAALFAAGALWLPGALIGHTASVVPPAKRAQIGQMVLADMTRDGMRICRGRLGSRALASLRRRVLDDARLRVAIFDADSADARAAALLPGGVILLRRDIVEQADGPGPAAEHILAAAAAARNHDPLVPLLESAGLRAAIRLLTTGTLPEAAVAGYGAALVTGPAPGPSLQEGRAEAGLPAGATPPSDEVPGEGALLDDGAWVSLQSICVEGP